MLLPLPAFHHTLLLILALLIFGLIVFWLWRIISKPKKFIKDLDELIIAIQKKAPNHPKTKALLKKLEPYRYDPKSPPVPRSLIQELQNHYKSLQKMDTIKKIPLKKEKI